MTAAQAVRPAASHASSAPLAAAPKYATGGHPVLPIVPGGKVPLADLAPHGLKDATTDPAVLAEWLRRAPDANLAIRCDGLLILDIDPGGEASLHALEREHGALPTTREQSTPRGGRHLLYRLPPGTEIGNSTAGLGRPLGLDVRAGERGYIVVAPSRNGTGTYRWLNSAPIADAPGWLVDLLTRPSRSESPPAPVRVTSTDSPYGRAALEAELAEIERAPEGQRNTRLNGAAFAAGQLQAGGELAAAGLEEALVGAATRAGLPQDEARRTVRSGLKGGRRAPRSAPAPAGGIPPERPASPYRELEPGEPTLEEALDDPGLFAEYVAPYGELVDDAEDGPTPFTGLSHAEVLELSFNDEPSELVQGLVPRGVLMLVAGLPETYKGWLCTKLAVSVAAGEGDVLGRPVVAGGPVGYLWQDDSTRNEAERVQLFARVHETPPSLPIRWFLNEGVVLPEDLERLRATIEASGFVLLVLDSLYNFAVGLDLKDRDVGQLFARIKAELCDATECTVVVVDHMPWATEQNRKRLRAYGDVFKGAAARAGIYIDAEGSKLYVEARGNSIAGFKRTPAYWDEEVLELRLVDTSRQEEADEELEARVLEWLLEEGERCSTSAIRKGVKGRNERIDAALERLCDRGEVQDSSRAGGAWSGEAGVPRYWIASVHAEETPPQLFGARLGETSPAPSQSPTSPTPPRPRRGGEVGRGEVSDHERDEHRGQKEREKRGEDGSGTGPTEPAVSENLIGTSVTPRRSGAS